MDDGYKPLRASTHPVLSRHAVLLILAGLAGFVAVTVFYFPGFMTFDSVRQLREARHGVFYAHHPPYMAWLWRQAEHLIPGPGGMFLVQVALFWIGMTVLVANAVRPPAGLLLLLVTGCCPPLLGTVVTLWKDVQVGVALLLAFALVQAAHRRVAPRGILLAVPIALFHASASRHNAITALIPLCGWWALTVAREWSFRRRIAGAALLATSVLGTLVGATVGLERALAGHDKVKIGQYMMMHDLVGLSLATGQDLLPSWVGRGPDGVTFREVAANYDPRTTDGIFGGAYLGPADPKGNPFEWKKGWIVPTTREDDYSELTHCWLRAVRSYPLQYARKRWTVFREVLGVSRDINIPIAVGVRENDLGVSSEMRLLTRIAVRFTWLYRDTVLFRCWFYLAVSSALLLLGWRRGRGEECTVAYASSVMYVVPLFAAAPSGDFRYTWWSTIVTIALAFTVFGTTGGRLERKEEGGHSLWAIPQPLP